VVARLLRRARSSAHRAADRAAIEVVAAARASWSSVCAYAGCPRMSPTAYASVAGLEVEARSRRVARELARARSDSPARRRLAVRRRAAQVSAI
jgi:hypothetical protein